MLQEIFSCIEIENCIINNNKQIVIIFFAISFLQIITHMLCVICIGKFLDFDNSLINFVIFIFKIYIDVRFQSKRIRNVDWSLVALHLILSIVLDLE